MSNYLDIKYCKLFYTLIAHPGNGVSSGIMLPAPKPRVVRSDDHVVVVGAGIAGLATAIRLAAQGVAVTVVESAEHPGGKIRTVLAAGKPVDSGPTVVTLRAVFDELFDIAGTRTEDHLTFRPAEILARHAWSATERLDLFADFERSADAVAAFAGPREAAHFRSFHEQAARVYRTLDRSFMRAPRPSPFGLTLGGGLAGARDLLATQPFSTLFDVLSRQFEDPRLRQLFARYATYCGTSPYLAPATLTLIAHLEQEGVWTIDGGMQRLPEALAAVARDLGIGFRLGAQVSSIDTAGGAASGVRLASGEALAADAVVFCGDVSALGTGLLGPSVARAAPATEPASRSLSALTQSLVAETDGFPLVHHNVFFSSDYAGEFADLVDRRRLPRTPTAYLCAQDRGAQDRGAQDRGAQDRGASIEGTAASVGEERLFLIINAPATGDTEDFRSEETERCLDRAYALMARCGLTVRPSPDGCVTTTPADFAHRFPGTGGAIYGPAALGWKASFKRHGTTTAIPGLYLAGGSVHPGPGIPMVALSGKLAAERVMADLTSRRRFHRAAMSGGTSTR